jgi:hypothetical protein
MTETNFRALCAELLAKPNYTWNDIPEEAWDLIQRARAALAQPEPVAPTDEELITTAEEAGLCYPTCWDLRDGEVPQMQYLRDFAHAVLARWGTPANNTREENLEASND